MTKILPPLDLHAHVTADINPRALEALGAVVFAVTRSLDEFEEVNGRSDAVTVWGIGCHPRLEVAQDRYDPERFKALLRHAPFVGEVGLDGSSKVAIARQQEVLGSMLGAIASTPRLVSVHSYRATKRVLDLIEQTGIEGAVLHWWLGSEAETRRALDLGCIFSVNQSMDIGKMKTAGVPLTSLLPETDHPSGNRRGQTPRQPGQTTDVEDSVAVTFGTTAAQVREQFWATLANHAGVVDAPFPAAVRAMLQHARRSA